jgi:hypothetical protein
MLTLETIVCRVVFDVHLCQAITTEGAQEGIASGLMNDLFAHI